MPIWLQQIIRLTARCGPSPSSCTLLLTELATAVYVSWLII